MKLSRERPRIESKPIECLDCRTEFVHVEVMPVDDEPNGLPPEVRCPECGGPLAPIMGVN